MLAMVHQFREFPPSEPWVFTAIFIGLGIIATVHVYRSVRKRRARDRRRLEAQHPEARPILPLERCKRQTCPVFHREPSECETNVRVECPYFIEGVRFTSSKQPPDSPL